MTQQDKMQARAPARHGAAKLHGDTGTRQVMPLPLGSIKQNEMPAKNLPAAHAALAPHALENFLDVPMTLVFEVGRTEITIKQLMEMNRGSLIELWQVPVDIIDIRINDRVVAYGEAIALKQRYGIRFGELDLPPGLEEGGNAR